MTLTSGPRLNDRLVFVWIAIATAYVVLIPVSKNYILYPVILSLAIVAAINIARNGTRIPKEALWVAGAWLVFVLYGTAVGIIRDAESTLRVLVFLLAWPLVYFVVSTGFVKQAIRIVFNVGAVCSVTIGAFFLIEGLSVVTDRQFPGLPSFVTSMFNMNHAIDDASIIAMTGTGLPSLMWWGAMWIAALAVSRTNLYLPPMWLRFLAGVFAIAGSFVAWRRAIIVVLVAAPFIALALWIVLIYRRGNFPKIQSLALITARVVACYLLAFFLGLGVQTQLPMLFGNAVNSVAVVAGLSSPDSDLNDPLYGEGKKLTVSEDDRLADLIRENERKALTSPETPADLFLGKGLGASIDRGEYERDMRPWQTELQYHAIFYWTGLLGVALVLTTLLLSARFLRRAFTWAGDLNGPLFVASVGAVALLVGNSSNPYLQAPGHMWPLFFPMMIACVALAQRPTGSLVIPPLDKILRPKSRRAR